MSSIIYRITNVVNSKFYIGKTSKTVQERFQRHCYNHQNQNTYLYNAMRKYKLAMKNRVHPHNPTYGMLGKK